MPIMNSLRAVYANISNPEWVCKPRLQLFLLVRTLHIKFAVALFYQITGVINFWRYILGQAKSVRAHFKITIAVTTAAYTTLLQRWLYEMMIYQFGWLFSQHQFHKVSAIIMYVGSISNRHRPEGACYLGCEIYMLHYRFAYQPFSMWWHTYGIGMINAIMVKP